MQENMEIQQRQSASSKMERSDQLSFKLKGCKSGCILQVGNRNQFILLIGESHLDEGNSDEFLKFLCDQMDCPIDVLIEKPYQSYWNIGYLDNTKSNLMRFYYPPLGICTDPSKIPSNAQIHSPRFREYKRNCLKPYGGKLKIWAADLRRTSIFYLIQRLSYALALYYSDTYNVNAETAFKNDLIRHTDLKEWFTEMKKIQKELFHFQLYQLSPDLYKRQIKERLTDLYKITPDFIKQLALLKDVAELKTTNVEEEMKEIMKSIDKSHIDLMKSMVEHPNPIIRKWQTLIYENMEKDPFYTLFCIHMVDLEICLRILKLIKKQEEGLIIVFAGLDHTTHIEKMLLQISSPDVPKIKKLDDICSFTDFEDMIKIPFLDCTKRIPRMKAYSNFQKT